jgi:tetratricopeptide (TPR) repeat protein
MKMKINVTVALLILLSLIWACTTTRKEISAPEAVESGLKEIQKGNSLHSRGCYQRAASHFFKAHAEFTAADYLPGIAISLNSIGNVYQADGDVENAVAFFDEAVAINTEIGDRQAVLQTLSNKAAALISADQLDRAETLISETENSTAAPFPPLLINKGILLIKKKSYTQAQSILEDTLSRVDKKDSASQAKINFALGRLMSMKGNTSGAIEYFSRALDSDRSVGFYEGMAGSLSHLGDAFLKQGAPEKALKYYKRAVKMYALIGDRPNAGRLMDKLEQVAASTGADIRLTVYFVKTWLEDKTRHGPCR